MRCGRGGGGGVGDEEDDGRWEGGARREVEGKWEGVEGMGGRSWKDRK